MAILENRVKTRNSLLELTKFILFSLRRFFVIFLIAACCYLLYFPAQKISRSSLEIYGVVLSVGSLMADVIIDNVKLVYDRLSYFRNLEAENIRLKLALAEAANSESITANALSENRELRKLLKVTDSSKYHSITTRLVGVSISPLSSSAIIEAGSNHNIKIDDLVTNQDGLIGRIINVSNNYSSVMLLTDPSSRVPVVTSSSKERGLLARQGDDMLLIYLPEEHKVEVGELIYTSGDGKIYPYGLLVGKVYKVADNDVFVSLSANLNNAEFVAIESKWQGD